MDQFPIEPPIPYNIDQGFDGEDQVLPTLNQDCGHAGLDLDRLIQAIDDEEEIAVWSRDPPWIWQGPIGLVMFGAGVRHREKEPR